ncbi:Hypp9211 [Branchiostoma lanceolatum]|uniref:Hypp9211 protein n=1 Tax=Branchiostoma lanceolatum TaxID=7740 RepID=A0A8J9ZFA5_BRALA|nr:Hypp9211 [Branchiostoma lanceolatum]
MNVRDATHDDYQAVMNIAYPTTFRDGFDYLSARFHGYVDDPDVAFLLVEIDGEVNIMYFCSDATTVKDRLTAAQISLPTLVPYQPTDIHRLLPPAFSAAVLSEGRVFVDWDPYKLSESNMKKFVEAGCHTLVDPTEPVAESLSFGGSYMTPRGRVYHIDIHCKDEALY